MSKQLNWRKAHLSSKRSASVKDEQEYREQDAAARWLNRIEKWGKPTPPRKARVSAQ